MKVQIHKLDKYLEAGIPISELLEEAHVIQTIIMGGYFSLGGMKEQLELLEGETLYLDTDTQNKKDAFAISISRKSDKGEYIRLGYIRKELAGEIMSVNDFHCTVFKELYKEDLSGRNVSGTEILLWQKKKTL